MSEPELADRIAAFVSLALISVALAALLIEFGPEIIAFLMDDPAERLEAEADDTGDDEYDDSQTADEIEEDEMDAEDEEEGAGW